MRQASNVFVEGVWKKDSRSIDRNWWHGLHNANLKVSQKTRF